MSAMYLRGGLPRKMSGTASSSGFDEHPVQGGNANAVIVRNTDTTNTLLVAFGKEMLDAGESWSLAKETETILLPAEFGSLYVKGSGGTATWEALVFVRRG